MNFDFATASALLGVGGIVGVLSVFIGIGGGIVMVPILPMVLGLRPAEATATSLLTILFVTMRNSWSFSRRDQLPWREARVMGSAAGAAAVATAMVAAHLPDQVMRFFFASALTAILVFVLRRDSRAQKAVSPNAAPFRLAPWLGLGGLCGLLSAGTGIGSGVVAGPLLIRLRMVPAERVVPVVNAMMLFNSAMGVVGYALSRPEWAGWRWGLIRLDAALWLFLGSQLAAPVAIRYQRVVGERQRRMILIGLLVLLSAKVWWEVWR